MTEPKFRILEVIYPGMTQLDFTGPHTIHGQGTFDFLHHHLNWPKPDAAAK